MRLVYGPHSRTAVTQLLATHHAASGSRMLQQLFADHTSGIHFLKIPPEHCKNGF